MVLRPGSHNHSSCINDYFSIAVVPAKSAAVGIVADGGFAKKKGSVSFMVPPPVKARQQIDDEEDVSPMSTDLVSGPTVTYLMTS